MHSHRIIAVIFRGNQPLRCIRPDHKRPPRNKRDFSTKVGALVSSTGAFQANCASRRLTVSAASGGLSTLVTEISNARGCCLSSSATRASAM